MNGLDLACCRTYALYKWGFGLRIYMGAQGFETGELATEGGMASEKQTGNPSLSLQKGSRSVFDLPNDFFNSCRLISGNSLALSPLEEISTGGGGGEGKVLKEEDEEERQGSEGRKGNPRLSCNTCKSEFDSLQNQRFHFKSDIHRFNVKLSLAGKDPVKEEEFDEMVGDSLFKDYDVSSISGSEDELEKGSIPNAGVLGKVHEMVKQKLFIHLQSGEIVSVWKCSFMNEYEDLLFENNKISKENGGYIPSMREGEVVERLSQLIREPRNKTHLRIVLLASGGHFAGCVFDGISIVAHKTFHRDMIHGISSLEEELAKLKNSRTTCAYGSATSELSWIGRVPKLLHVAWDDNCLHPSFMNETPILQNHNNWVILNA